MLKKRLSVIVIAFISISQPDIRCFNSKLSLFIQTISILNYDIFASGPKKSYVFITPDNGYEFYNSSEKELYTKEITYKFAARMRVKYLHSKKQDVLNRYHFEELIKEHSITKKIPFYKINRIEIETKNGDNFTIRFDTDSTYSIYTMVDDGLELIRKVPITQRKKQ
ncbi:MAG: hypothetical protein IJU72_08910 [Bacteroidales bacterium]|nr:hypothetical protein [Bacteroidales bacterium]